MYVCVFITVPLPPSPTHTLHTLPQDVFPTDDGFFDMITRFQGHRLDDQRTSLPPALASSGSGVRNKEDDLLDVLWQVQGSRIEEQRCPMTSAPHVMPAASHWEESEAECLTADELFELIFSCQVHSVLDRVRGEDICCYSVFCVCVVCST